VQLTVAVPIATVAPRTLVCAREADPMNGPLSCVRQPVEVPVRYEHAPDLQQTVVRGFGRNRPRAEHIRVSEHVHVAAGLAERAHDRCFVLGDGNCDRVIVPGALRWLGR
jgi:hypothetical protein